MKYTVLVLTFLFSCSSTESEKEKPESLRNFYKENHIKEYQSFEYEYKFGEVDSSTKKLVEHFFFDSLGRNTKRIFYQDRYESFKGYFPDTQIVVLDFSEFAKSRIVKLYSGRMHGDLRLSDKEIFDEQDRLVESVTYDSTGELEEKSVVKWNGEEFTKVNYDKFGELKSKYIQGPSIEKLTTKDGGIDYEMKLISTSGDTKTFQKTDTSGTEKIVIKKNKSIYEWKLFDSQGQEKYGSIAKVENGLAVERTSYTQREPKVLTRFIYTKY
jgi:hypothetical protein